MVDARQASPFCARLFGLTRARLRRDALGFLGCSSPPGFATCFFRNNGTVLFLVESAPSDAEGLISMLSTYVPRTISVTHLGLMYPFNDRHPVISGATHYRKLGNDASWQTHELRSGVCVSITYLGQDGARVGFHCLHVNVQSQRFG